jgi:hypothetical protein
MLSSSRYLRLHSRLPCDLPMDLPIDPSQIREPVARVIISQYNRLRHSTSVQRNRNLEHLFGTEASFGSHPVTTLSQSVKNTRGTTLLRGSSDCLANAGASDDATCRLNR